MFSVETTYYCASCRKVKVKDWQFSKGVDALAMYENVIDKHYDNENILTSFVDSIVCVDDGMRKIFDDMHNITNKEAA